LAPLAALVRPGAASSSPAPPARSAPPPLRPEAGTAARAAVPPAPAPAMETPRPPAPGLSLGRSPIPNPIPSNIPPGNLEQLRRACSEALKQAGNGLPRTLASLPHMATELRLEGHTLHWFFPPDVRNTVQDLEREQANPHLLEALRQVLPGLERLVIAFAGDNKPRPEDALRSDPEFQRLLAETGGEIVDIRQEGS